MKPTFKEKCIAFAFFVIVFAVIVLIGYGPHGNQPGHQPDPPTPDASYAMVQPPLTQEEIQICRDAGITPESPQKETRRPNPTTAGGAASLGQSNASPTGTHTLNTGRNVLPRLSGQTAVQNLQQTILT